MNWRGQTFRFFASGAPPIAVFNQLQAAREWLQT